MAKNMLTYELKEKEIRHSLTLSQSTKTCSYTVKQTPAKEIVPLDTAVILWDFENVTPKSNGSDFMEYYNFLHKNFKVDNIQIYNSYDYNIKDELKNILFLMHISYIDVRSKKKQAVDMYIINEIWILASKLSKHGAIPKTIVIIASDSDYIATVRSIKQYLNPKQKFVTIYKPGAKPSRYYDMVFDKTLIFPGTKELKASKNLHKRSLKRISWYLETSSSETSRSEINSQKTSSSETDNSGSLKMSISSPIFIPKDSKIVLNYKNTSMIISKAIFNLIKHHGSILLSRLGIHIISFCHLQNISIKKYREIIHPNLVSFIRKDCMLTIHGLNELMSVMIKTN